MTEPTGRRQALLPNLALGLTVSLLLLLALEGGARLVERGREPRPAVEDYIWDWEQKWDGEFYTIRSDGVGWPPWEEFNADGVRDRTHAPEKPEGVTRLVCLGDSVTLGDGIEAAEAYPQVLQALLDEEGPGVEVFNLALWGWSTRQQRIAYRSLARRYSPDQVLLAICLNDIPELQNNLSRPPGWLSWLHERSALVRVVVDAPGREIRSVEELFEEPETSRVAEGFERFFGELRALHDDVVADGASLSLAVLPFRFQLEPGAPQARVQRRILDFCAEEGLRCVDLLPELRSAGPQAFHDYDHLSPLGAAAVARILASSSVVPRPLPVDELLGERSLGVLLEALDAPRVDQRRAAAWRLGRMGHEAVAAVEPLTRMLEAPEEPLRAEAARALRGLAEAGVEVRGAEPALFERLADPRQRVRWEAARTLFRLGARAPESVRPLTLALESDDRFVRAFAAFSLGQLGALARDAVPALIAALEREEAFGRGGAALALSKMGPVARVAIPTLVSSLSSEDADRRWKAARALGRIGLAVDGALEALVTALADPHERVREHAARALGRIGPEAGPAVDALVRATGDPEPGVRREAEAALVAISR